MSRKSCTLIAFFLVCAFFSSTRAEAQCTSQITLVPLTAMKAASKGRDFIRFKYYLSASDSLLVRSHEDTETSIGPYDTGFAITRDGNVLQHISIRELPEIRHEEPEYAESFSTLAVTRACRDGEPIFFVTMQYMGDETSPALPFVLVPTATGYIVSTLPMISGGIVEVSRSDPFRLRAWDNLHEGGCETCPTAYEIDEYEVRGGKPVKTRQYRTRRSYTSGEFDDQRRLRFVR